MHTMAVTPIDTAIAMMVEGDGDDEVEVEVEVEVEAEVEVAEINWKRSQSVHPSTS